jgi:hypothetical protein
MKQQQIFAEFLSSHVIYFCRFCDAESENKNDLYKDIVFHERYHHEISTLRKRSAMINDKFKKLIFLFNNDLKSESFAFQKLISILNLIMSCSSDFLHSEYFEIICKLFSFLYIKIFIIRVFVEFIKKCHDFSFSFDWDRI